MESVTCEVQYNGVARGLVCAAPVATGGLVFATPLPVSPRVALLCWIALVAIRALRRLGEVAAVRLDADGSVFVRDARGGWRAGQLRDGSCVFPWLTVVRWRPAGARLDRTVLLLPSMVDAERFRALRVLLKWR